MPNPTHPPHVEVHPDYAFHPRTGTVGAAMHEHALQQSLYAQGGREVPPPTPPDRQKMSPMVVVANNRDDVISLRRHVRADALVLRIDRRGRLTDVTVLEPNVRELRDMLNRWLGE